MLEQQLNSDLHHSDEDDVHLSVRTNQQVWSFRSAPCWSSARVRLTAGWYCRSLPPPALSPAFVHEGWGVNLLVHC